MIRSSSERIKNIMKETSSFRREVEDDVKKIADNDGQFFEALLLYAEGMRLTFGNEPKSVAERDGTILSYAHMLYAILKTLDKSGFIKIAQKPERIANDVFDEYIKNI